MRDPAQDRKRCHLHFTTHLAACPFADQPQNGYWSVTLPSWATVLVLNSYLPYGPTSRQYRWAAQQLVAVDRTATPWLLVLMHGAPRTTFVPSFQASLGGPAGVCGRTGHQLGS